MLIFKKKLDQEKDNDEYHKRNQYVPYPFIASVVPFLVLFIGIRNDKDEDDEEYHCENELAGAEHIFYFYANLI